MNKQILNCTYFKMTLTDSNFQNFGRDLWCKIGLSFYDPRFYFFSHLLLSQSILRLDVAEPITSLVLSLDHTICTFNQGSAETSNSSQESREKKKIDRKDIRTAHKQFWHNLFHTKQNTILVI